MDISNDFTRLRQVLELTGYPYWQRLSHFPTLLDITVQDFICIVAFLGNQACHQFCRRGDPFPHVYSKAKFCITREEQNFCVERILTFAEFLKFPQKMTKSDILSSATRRYTQKRADLLMVVCNYVDQVFVTPPQSPKQFAVQQS